MKRCLLLIAAWCCAAALDAAQLPQLMPRSKVAELEAAQTRELLERYNNLAWAMATHAGALDGATAVEIAKGMLVFNDGNLPDHQLDTVAACFARAGDFTKAVEYQSRAIAAVKGRGRGAGNLSDYESRLHLFQSGKAWQDGADVALLPVRETRPGGAKVEGFFVGKEKGGRWKLYHENGKPKAEGVYIDGLQAGLWKQWREDGSPLDEGWMSEGRRIGPWKEWYANGQLSGEGDYLEDGPWDGRRSAHWRFYHDNGRLRAEQLFINGEVLGAWANWHANGIMAEEVVYTDDDHGMWRRWDADGKLLSERHLPELGDNDF